MQGLIPMLTGILAAAAIFAGLGFYLGSLRSKSQSRVGIHPEPSQGFSRMFASSPGGMALLEGNRITSATSRLEKILGVSERGLEGSDASLLFGEPGENSNLAEIWSTLANGDSLLETKARRADGSFTSVEVRVFPFPWNGQDLRILEVKDIENRIGEEEARRQSEMALRKSEGDLRALLSHSPFAFFALDKDGNFTIAEGKGLEGVGLQGANLVGQSAFAKTPRLRGLQPLFKRVFEGKGVDETVEISGSFFEVRMRPIPGPNGSQEGAMGLAMDVTELRRAEQDLRKSREHLRAVISNAPLILFALDKKGTYTLSEGRGLESLGLQPADSLGKSAFELHRNAPQLALNVRRALSGEEFTTTIPMGGLWFETYYSPVFEGYDEVAGVIGVAINVTDRKHAEDALKRSEDQLRHSRKMEAIGRVAGGVAHDFNNLLTAITGYTELLLTGSGKTETDQGRKSLEEIRNAAERAATLTRQLLAFSRRQVLAPKVIQLNQMVSDMDKMLRRLIREDIELVTALDPTLGDVWVDPGQIEQVVLNLALNARDAMPNGGQLTLETANVELDGHTARAELFLVPGSYVMLCVSDTGMGMDDEVKAHLFEPFFTTKEEGTALGLGLSAVYGIVKQSGGTISVETEKGKGTTFKVYLPRADKTAARRGNISESLHGEETVLLVEDEEAVRTLIREILVMHGYRVLEARQGGEAILESQRQNGPIHMLLTDVVMANMSGKELAAHLRPLRPEMKVLYISGYSEDAVLGEGSGVLGLKPSQPSGAGLEFSYQDDVAFLAKPFTPKTLAMKVREVLDGKPTAKANLLHRV